MTEALEPTPGSLPAKLIGEASGFMAKLFPGHSKTVTENLAKGAGITQQEVHIELVGPLVGSSNRTARRLASDQIKHEADAALLVGRGDILVRQLQALNRVEAERPKALTNNTTRRDYQDIRNRIEGDIEILRLSALEDEEF